MAALQLVCDFRGTRLTQVSRASYGARWWRKQPTRRETTLQERGPSPLELVKQASHAARLQDLDIIRLEAGVERRALGERGAHLRCVDAVQPSPAQG